MARRGDQRRTIDYGTVGRDLPGQTVEDISVRFYLEPANTPVDHGDIDAARAVIDAELVKDDRIRTGARMPKQLCMCCCSDLAVPDPSRHALSNSPGCHLRQMLWCARAGQTSPSDANAMSAFGSELSEQERLIRSAQPSWSGHGNVCFWGNGHNRRWRGWDGSGQRPITTEHPLLVAVPSIADGPLPAKPG